MYRLFNEQGELLAIAASIPEVRTHLEIHPDAKVQSPNWRTGFIQRGQDWFFGGCNSVGSCGALPTDAWLLCHTSS